MFVKVEQSLFDYSIKCYQRNKNSSLGGENLKSNNIDYELMSLYRAKSKILDYAKNNVFNYFFTLTIDNKKCDITKDFEIAVEIRKFFNNFKTRYDNNFKFILVSEYGKKNNRLHFHGLLYIENKDYLKRCSSRSLGTYYRFENLFKRFGANSLIFIHDYSIKCAMYVSKYITKTETKKGVFYSNYWCSRGLKTSKTLHNMDLNINYTNETLQQVKEYLLGIIPILDKVLGFKDGKFCSSLFCPIEKWKDLFTIGLQSVIILNEEKGG